MTSVKNEYIDANGDTWTCQEVSFGKSRGIHIWGNQENFQMKFAQNPHNADSK